MATQSARSSVIVVVAVALLVSFSATARASSFTFTGVVSEFTGFGDALSPYITRDSCSGTTLTSCSGSFGVGSFSGTATASGSFAGSLTMGAGIDFTNTVSGTTSDPYNVSARAQSEFTDLLTVSGGTTGTSGFLQMTFTTDGSISCIWNISPSCSSLLPTASVSEQTKVGSTSLGFTGVDLKTGTNNTIVLDAPILFGEQNSLALFLSLQGFTANTYGPISVEKIADFSNTLTLTSVQILSADKQIVPNGELISAGNFAYPTNPTPAPEPGSMILFGTGFSAVILGLRRGKA